MMKKIKTLLVCNSNMFVPVVLTEVLSHPDQQYLVISDTENIKQFFEFLAIPNVLYCHYGFDKSKDGYWGFIKKRNLLLQGVSQYSISSVIFFHAEFGGMANWLISKLSNKIPVKYCKLYDSIPAKKAPLSLKSIKMKLCEYIYWGQKMDIMMFSKPFPSLPESFFRKVNADEISMPVEFELINLHLKNKLSALGVNGKYILLTGTAVHNGWYDEQKYTAFINKLIEALGKKNVVSKCHPRYKDLYGLEKGISQLPSFIPGNVLLKSFDYFIGLESTLLVEAAQAGKLSISYLDWLRPDDSRIKIQHSFFDNRLQGKGNIYFPKSMAELKDLLDIKK